MLKGFCLLLDQRPWNSKCEGNNFPLCGPNELGLSFQKDDRTKTAVEAAISKYGKNEAFRLIDLCITHKILTVMEQILQRAQKNRRATCTKKYGFLMDFLRIISIFELVNVVPPAASI